MKKMFLCFLVLLMCGCTKVSDVRNEVDNLVKDMAGEEINLVANHKKKYYSYYVPTSVSNIESTDTHNIFEYNGVNIMMNLNITDIITYSIYSQKKDDSEIFENELIIYNRKNLVYANKEYDLSIYKFSENYVVRLDSDDVVMASSMKENYVVNTLRQMILIASSVTVNYDAVIDNFSNKDFIDFEKEQVDLFKIIVPKDGRIEELIDPKWAIDTNETTDPEVENTEETE